MEIAVTSTEYVVNLGLTVLKTKKQNFSGLVSGFICWTAGRLASPSKRHTLYRDDPKLTGIQRLRAVTVSPTGEHIKTLRNHDVNL